MTDCREVRPLATCVAQARLECERCRVPPGCSGRLANIAPVAAGARLKPLDGYLERVRSALVDGRGAMPLRRADVMPQPLAPLAVAAQPRQLAHVPRMRRSAATAAGREQTSRQRDG